MPAERLPMRQVREVLRLKYLCGQSGHRIAAAIGISRYTVAEYLRRAAVLVGAGMAYLQFTQQQQAAHICSSVIR